MASRTELKPLEREGVNPRQQLKDQSHEVSLLRRELKESERVIREQSLELRDWKKQCAKLQEVSRQNALLQDASRNRAQSIDHLREQMRQEHDELIHHLNQQRDTINHLRLELINRKTHIESLTMQTREAVEIRGNLEDANRKLKHLNRELSENLTECKDDLLRMQPPSQISDTEVSEHYSALHQHIARWVDDETEESHPLEQRFEALPIHGDELPEMLRKHLHNDSLKLAKKYPTAQPLVLRHLITSFLDAHVLRGDMDLFGLDAGAAAVIRGVEHGMKLLEPKRGKFGRNLPSGAPYTPSPISVVRELNKTLFDEQTR